MSLDAALAALAGALAASGVVDLAAARAGARRRPWRALLVGALGRLGRRTGAPSPPQGLAARLEAAGVAGKLDVAELAAVKAGGALLALVAAVPLAATAPGRLPLFVGVGVPAGAFLAPDVWLARRARARGRAMELELPDLLDLLRVALQAGLPVARAFAEVARRDQGLLAREWRIAAAELELGLPMGEVLGSLRRRCPAPGIPALVAALARAARHGTPLGETLSAQAGEARAGRARRIREDAARAAPKIQLVVALLLVPSVLLLVAAALVGALVK